LEEREEVKVSGLGRPMVPRPGWDEQLDDYLRFIKERDRVPSQYAEDLTERVLNSWLKNQKASLQSGLLLRERVAKLNELLPGWSSPYRLRASWDQMLARAVQFKAERGRWPSASSSDTGERNLANWLYRQTATRTAIRDRNHAERVVKLNNALTDWRRGPSGDAERWNRRMGQLMDHVRTYGRFPVMGPSSLPEEYALGKWISVQRHALKKGTLYPERLAVLNELLPDWRQPSH
jgi:hypothetical protein